MLAIPILDLRGGAVAHTAATREPIGAARAWALAGFRRLHVTDLDAAHGSGSNSSVVEEIIRDAALDVQAEGGVDSTEQIDRLIEIGAARVILGARALAEPDWLVRTAELFPGSVIVATDVHERRVSTRGWVRTLPLDVLDVVAELSGLPLGGLLVISTPADRSRGNVDLALLEDIADASDFPVFAAGGIATMNDLRALEHRGVSAVLLGAELHSGALEPRAVAQEFAE